MPDNGASDRPGLDVCRIFLSTLARGAPRAALFVVALAGPAHGVGERIPVLIAGQPFRLELAADPATRTRGLMFRRSIDERGGMLFVFPDDRRRSFWMKNCIVDMDVLFLDRRGVVVDVLEMFAEPLRKSAESMADYHRRLRRYPSSLPARFAIELKHGSAARLGVARGDRVRMDVEGLARRAT